MKTVFLIKFVGLFVLIRFKKKIQTSNCQHKIDFRIEKFRGDTERRDVFFFFFFFFIFVFQARCYPGEIRVTSATNMVVL